MPVHIRLDKIERVSAKVLQVACAKYNQLWALLLHGMSYSGDEKIKESEMMKDRILGIDVARALAVMGMIIVNFKIVFGSGGSERINIFTGYLEGKAAATFVVLAGIGLAFISNKALKAADRKKLKVIQFKIFKRALFLFAAGLLFYLIWIADILHFYGIYMLITILFLRKNPKQILGFAALLILIYPVLIAVLDFNQGWNFSTFAYSGFWTFPGFIRNLFFNGFHPVIPWTSFMLLGLWFGKQDLNNHRFVKKAMYYGLGIFVLLQFVSKMLIRVLSNADAGARLELQEILGTAPMPPLPLYMISGSAFAIFIISACILLSKRYETTALVNTLRETGQLALSIYFAHVLIGMGLVEMIAPGKMGNFSALFSLSYAIVFMLGSVLYAHFWLQKRKLGPMEWLMRKIS